MPGRGRGGRPSSRGWTPRPLGAGPMREDPGEDGGLDDHSDDPHQSPAPGAAERVHLEDPAKQLRPAEPAPSPHRRSSVPARRDCGRNSGPAGGQRRDRPRAPPHRHGRESPSGATGASPGPGLRRTGHGARRAGAPETRRILGGRATEWRSATAVPPLPIGRDHRKLCVGGDGVQLHRAHGRVKAEDHEHRVMSRLSVRVSQRSVLWCWYGGIIATSRATACSAAVDDSGSPARTHSRTRVASLR